MHKNCRNRAASQEKCHNEAPDPKNTKIAETERLHKKNVTVKHLTLKICPRFFLLPMWSVHTVEVPDGGGAGAGQGGDDGQVVDFGCLNGKKGRRKVIYSPIQNHQSSIMNPPPLHTIPSAVSCLRRSWPQAASISWPFSMRRVAVTPAFFRTSWKARQWERAGRSHSRPSTVL